MFILGPAECLAHQNGLVNGGYDHCHHHHGNRCVSALGSRVLTHINQKGNSHPGGKQGWGRALTVSGAARCEFKPLCFIY